MKKKKKNGMKTTRETRLDDKGGSGSGDCIRSARQGAHGMRT